VKDHGCGIGRRIPTRERRRRREGLGNLWTCNFSNPTSAGYVLIYALHLCMTTQHCKSSKSDPSTLWRTGGTRRPTRNMHPENGLKKTRHVFLCNDGIAQEEIWPSRKRQIRNEMLGKTLGRGSWLSWKALDGVMYSFVRRRKSGYKQVPRPINL
jgi:hypothetical protein